jgi:hypothetical protein
MYPDDSIQACVAPSPWWVTDTARDVRRGRLIRAFLPHVLQVPMVLIPTGRSTATDHSRADYRIEPLKATQPARLPRLPQSRLFQLMKVKYELFIGQRDVQRSLSAPVDLTFLEH